MKKLYMLMLALFISLMAACSSEEGKDTSKAQKEEHQQFHLHNEYLQYFQSSDWNQMLQNFDRLRLQLCLTKIL
jgi:outer membrane biogenesis lipoprotein LolB